MKKFLCYDTNDAASGKLNVSTNGMLKPNSTVPPLANGSASYQQLVTDGNGNTKWEDRLAYDDSRVVVNVEIEEGINVRWVRVFDEVPSFVFVGAHVKVWFTSERFTSTAVDDSGHGFLSANGESVFITLSDNVIVDTTTGGPLAFPKKGVYFFEADGDGYIAGFSSADSDTPEITWDGNIEFTKTIDPKYIPADHINSLIDEKLGVIENGSY